MRGLVDRERLLEFMRVLGRETRSAARVYLTGGSTAVLLDWRASTIDIDLKLEPDADDVLRAIPALKETLSINVELASPDDFIPELPAWRDRSPWIAREGALNFHHYDFYSQALAKIERRHARDIEDVMAMSARGLIFGDRLLTMFNSIEAEMYRYPSIDPRSFRRSVEEIAGRLRSSA